MKWLKREPKRYEPVELVRLITTNDERSMLLTTSPLRVFAGNPSVRYEPTSQRRPVAIDPEVAQGERSGPGAFWPAGSVSTANNLPWPRPIIIPADLVPRDFDDNDEDGPSGLGKKYAQQSAESFFPMRVGDGEADRFNEELWSRPIYRLRCHIWSFWQKHLKDWWFFIRYPLAFGAALAYAIATVVHLARSHP